MLMFRFDRAETAVSAHGSRGLRTARVATTDGGVRLTCLSVAPGGTIGSHPAAAEQLFLVVAGDGWVAGADGRRVPVAVGDGVRWSAGEAHTSGSARGMTALAVEGAPFELSALAVGETSGRA